MNNDKVLVKLFTQLMQVSLPREAVIDLLLEIEQRLLSDTNSISDGVNSNDIGLNTGNAINTNLAGKCFKDFVRTYTFMLGTYQCVQEKLKYTQSVEILYAGTGPYATIILPLLYLLKSENISITTLEINETTYEQCKVHLQKLNKGKYFNENLLINAMAYSPQFSFDIIISETMDKALCREPQLAIFSHLHQFLKPKGNLIPECISVDLFATSMLLEKDVDYDCYTDTQTREYNAQFREYIDRIIDADLHFFKNTKLQPDKIISLKTVSTKQVKIELIDLILLTEVQIFGQVRLLEDDSWLTKKYNCFAFTDASRGKEFEALYFNTFSPRIELIPLD